ncbi:helix-turn-helix domain-containing protein [Streptococcus dysgalactiae]|uniref:AlbA family DNA-binding domain-containing protein n=1 Tax=Streptococcus dysgalactiae TaxID=1334 RepID=UPI001FAA6C4F|nr:ATP-binding protein [Streptococcus dysgalactiae]
MSREFLEEIISEKISESDTLEYKDYYFTNGKLTSLDQKELAKLFKEICALANYNGGKIILGLKEDNNHNPSELSDVGVNKDTFEMWKQALRNKLSVNIIPSLYGIKTELVEVRDDTNCIIIDVPRSVLKPHAYNTGSNHEFYIRNGNTSIQMRYNDLKNSFDELTFKQEKIRRFIDDRISFILNGDLDESLSYDSSLVLHIIPEWSLNEANFLNLGSIQYSNVFSVFSPPQNLGTTSYNADGLLRIYGSENRRNVMSYTQIFSNSCIESVEARLLNDYKDGIIYDWNKLEKLLVENISSFVKDLNSLNVYGGFYFTVTLLNVKNKRVKQSDWNDTSAPLIRNLIRTPLIKWNPGDKFTEVLYPLLTTLAYSCGLNRSYFYTNSGDPIEDKFDFLKNDIYE